MNNLDPTKNARQQFNNSVDPNDFPALGRPSSSAQQPIQIPGQGNSLAAILQSRGNPGHQPTSASEFQLQKEDFPALGARIQQQQQQQKGISCCL
jgi:hypothetical protein